MTPREAREAVNLTLEQAAKRARIGVPYLRQIERRGVDSPWTAERLASIYACGMNVFLRGEGSPPPRLTRNSGQGARTRRTGARTGRLRSPGTVTK